MSTYGETLIELEEQIKNGDYKQADLSLFNKIRNIEISRDALDLEKFVLESYQEYLENIKSLPNEIRPLFLKALKNEEVVASHSLEKVNPFTISLYMLAKKKPALDRLLEIDGNLKSNDFKRIHYKLLENTPSSEEEIKYRDTNNLFVGYYIDNKRVIEYLPIDYKLIPKAVLEFLNFYNQKETNFEYAFFKCFIIHGLLSGLQIFKDGNTRFARMLQYVDFYKNTKEFIDKNLELPALYTSKTYYPYRKQYRELIKQIVLDNSDEIWNKWFIFNYHRFEDQIRINEENIKSLKKTF